MQKKKEDYNIDKKTHGKSPMWNLIDRIPIPTVKCIQLTFVKKIEKNHEKVRE